MSAHHDTMMSVLWYEKLQARFSVHYVSRAIESKSNLPIIQIDKGTEHIIEDAIETKHNSHSVTRGCEVPFAERCAHIHTYTHTLRFSLRL